MGDSSVFYPLKNPAACQHGGDMLVRAAGDTKIPVKGRAGVVWTIYTFFVKISLKKYKTLVLLFPSEELEPLIHFGFRHLTCVIICF